MDIRTPEELKPVLSEFDRKTISFCPLILASALSTAIKKNKELVDAERLGFLAEIEAFWYSPATDSWSGNDALNQLASPLTLEYWAERCEKSTHPVMKSRYGALVWIYGKDKRFKFDKSRRTTLAIRTIEGAIENSRLEGKENLMDVRTDFALAIRLALSIRKSELVSDVVDAVIAYVETTHETRLCGTYCYLLELLLLQDKPPPLTTEQELRVVSFFEGKLATIASPQSPLHLASWIASDVGDCLYKYYLKRQRHAECCRVALEVAKTHERNAMQISGWMKHGQLTGAIPWYEKANAKDDIDRLRIEVRRLGLELTQQTVPTEIRVPIDPKWIEELKATLAKASFADSLEMICNYFLPLQQDVQFKTEQLREIAPIESMFEPCKRLMARGLVISDLSNTAGDDEGIWVNRTADAIGWNLWLMDICFGVLQGQGLTPDAFFNLIKDSKLLNAGDHEIIQRGIEKHFSGDYLSSIHLLLPQIERAIVELLTFAGKPIDKKHQSGRGESQEKNLNDVLSEKDWPLRGELSESIRLYFVSTLSHPKGMNLRNKVCHGLLAASLFTISESNLLLHILLVLKSIDQLLQDKQPNP